VTKKIIMKKEEKKPKLSIVTPKGRALFVYLKEPNKRFNADNDKLECSIILDRNEASVQEFITKVEEFADKCGVPCPIKDGKTEGEVVLKSKTKLKPAVLDAHRNVIPEAESEFRSGSTIKLWVVFQPYDQLGGGLTAYLNGVQLLSRVNGGGDASSMFGDEEGYTHVAAEASEEVPF
jgi:hypothetical protein